MVRETTVGRWCVGLIAGHGRRHGQKAEAETRQQQQEQHQQVVGVARTDGRERYAEISGKVVVLKGECPSQQAGRRMGGQ